MLMCKVWADGRGQGVTSETWSQLHGTKHRGSALDRPGQILQGALQILSIYSIFQMSLLIECLMTFVHRGGWKGNVLHLTSLSPDWIFHHFLSKDHTFFCLSGSVFPCHWLNWLWHTVCLGLQLQHPVVILYFQGLVISQFCTGLLTHASSQGQKNQSLDQIWVFT